MNEIKSISIKIEKPTFRQRIIIITANLMLWLIVKFFKDDEDKMKSEMKDIIISAYKSL